MYGFIVFLGEKKEKERDGKDGKEKDGRDVREKEREREVNANMAALLLKKDKQKPQPSHSQPQTFIRPKNPKSTLQFDSNFESGNLFAVFRQNKYEYDLILNNDINSKGSIQWFYFSVQGLEAGMDYTFNIVNFTKNDSLFNYGMRPVLYSMAENGGYGPGYYEVEGQGQGQGHGHGEGRPGWYRYGRDVEYFQGEIPRESNSGKFYYTLRFVVNWRVAGDKIYLAQSYPYTYSRILGLTRRMVDKVHKNEQKQQKDRSQLKKAKQDRHAHPITNHIEQLKIGKTVSQRDLHIYLITPPKKSIKPTTSTSTTTSKQIILIMARQHPGQTQGSFVCEGILKQLVENTGSREVKFLLENYQVYVIPMVNVDGVIYGNYRTNLAGKDLNRKWDNSQANVNNSILLTPEIVAIKQFLTSLHKTGHTLRFVLDLHGHSKKLNSFFYGNPNPPCPQLSKLYPYICSRYSEAIQFMDCTFAAESYKKRAARIFLSSVYQQLQVYTFESSFYGYRGRDGKVVEFTPEGYFGLGRVLVKGLYVMLYRESAGELGTLESTTKITDIPIETYIKFEAQLKQNQLLLKIGDAESSGSQSKPQQGQLNIEQIVDQSQNDEGPDQRVIVSNKIPNKSTLVEKPLQPPQQISKTKSIRISSRKTTPQQSTIEYKELGKQYRNKKLITISQVNGVLADKYHISLVPIERVAYRMGRKCDGECQTERNGGLGIRVYRGFEIEEKGGLVGLGEVGGGGGWGEDGGEEEANSVISFGHSASKKGGVKNQPKKHSEIVAEIQRGGANSRHIHYRSNYQTQKDLINRRKISLKQPSQNPNSKTHKKCSRFTQTMASFKTSSSSTTQTKPVDNRFNLNPLSLPLESASSMGLGGKLSVGENEARIAQMEKINREVLRIYSKKSTVVDLSLKPKVERSGDKNKELSMEKKQLNFMSRY